MSDFEIIEDIIENEKLCKGVRSYNWCLVSYNDINNLKPLLDKVTKYAYILHDKDLCKNPHYHIMIYTTKEISYNQLKLILNECSNPYNQNTFMKVVRDKKMCFRYLTHKDNLDKYQYEDSDIVTTDYNFFSLEKSVKDYTNLLDDILNKVSYRDMAKKWGRDYILNRLKFEEFAYIMRAQELRCDINGEIKNN